MAISKLRIRHAADGKSVGQCLNERIDYGKNPNKTRGGELVSTYQCSPDTAAEEFLISKQIYETMTGRSRPPDKDVISYLLLQSFKQGEITPELANKIGFELAKEFTKGRHQFIVSTHVDRQHIHNHIEFNSTTLDCAHKFDNYFNSAFDLRKINDKLCAERGLSVIEETKEKGKHYAEWKAEKTGTSWKAKLRDTIDSVLTQCKTFDDFLNAMKSAGYKIKQGKYISLCAPGQEKFIRLKERSLGADYSEEAIRDRIGKVKESGKRQAAVPEQSASASKQQKPNKDFNMLKTMPFCERHQ